MDLRKKFATDTKSEVTGVWEDLSDTCSVLVARADNPKFKEMMQELLKPHKAALRAGALSEAAAEKVMVKALASTILIGWKGMKLDGKDLEYSTANAEKVLGDPELKDFRTLIINLSEDASRYRKAEVEEAEKNSGRGSAGK